MKALKVFLVLLLAAAPFSARPATNDEDDGWMSFGHALSLAQVFMRIAASPVDQQKAFDDVLAGNNAEANQALTGLFEEMTSDMPSQYKDKVASIGRDLAGLARKQNVSGGRSALPQDPLQARKDLTAMGLRYHDPKDFLEAVKRDDLLAVELFIAGRGVNLSSKDASGRTAADIARANGNARMGELLARNLPATR